MTAATARGPELFLRAMWARSYVRLVGSFRQPEWLLTDAVFPNLAMCAFVLLYRALGAPRSYEAMAVIGGILVTFWFNVLWGMGAQMFWEKQQGQLQLYFAAPCSRMAILTGMAVGGLVTSTIRALVGVAIGVFVFRIQLAEVSWPMFTMVFLLTMTALYALGMTLSSLFVLYGREAWHLCNALAEPVQFASGLYFPVRTFGTVGATLAALIPLTLGVDAVRQVLLGEAAQGLLPLSTEAALLAGLTVAFLWMAARALEHLERLSKREGRLTQRWQ